MYQPNFYYILVKILTLLFIYIFFYTWESCVFYNYENTVFRLHISHQENYLLTPKTVHTSFIRKMFVNVNKTVRKKVQAITYIIWCVNKIFLILVLQLPTEIAFWLNRSIDFQFTVCPTYLLNLSMWQRSATNWPPS